MRNFSLACLGLVAIYGLATPVRAEAQVVAPLRLVQTIPMPNVKGRLDHLDVDVGGRRLFVSGLENGSVEVVDLKAGKWVRSIPGFHKPQGILFVPELKKLFVASGDDGVLRVYDSGAHDLLASIKLDIGPNRLAYDTERKLLYVGYGGKDAGKDYGEIAVIDAVRDKVAANIRVAAHPAELLLNNSGERLIVLIPASSHIQLVDTKKREVVATWPVSSKQPGDAAFDEPFHRLLIGTHTPPEMIVMDSNNGREIAGLPTVEGMDGVYYDSLRKRVYISGGRGFDAGYVFVYQQRDADHYAAIAKIPTRAGAGTSFWSPQLNRYYVAAPAHNGYQASILVFEPQI